MPAKRKTTNASNAVDTVKTDSIKNEDMPNVKAEDVKKETAPKRKKPAAKRPAAPVEPERYGDQGRSEEEDPFCSI